MADLFLVILSDAMLQEGAKPLNAPGDELIFPTDEL
jgi:hypothetical protein